MNTTDIVNEILNRSNSMTIADLQAINVALKERWNSLQYHTARTFRNGDEVKFQSRARGMITGKVTKVNTKTVQVLANGTNWKVAPSLLSHI